ncbi:MAG TPA: integrase arm-type DNA-binding domain-containing protein [Acetobacteraceae bacterium]|nr:integrase arm-type DNA-binding domain-containing protein [Acetobacteraceae bacterium]
MAGQEPTSATRKAVATAADLKAVRPPGRYRVKGAPGLYLLVRPTGAKFWLLRYMLRGRSREMGLGPADWDGRHGGVTLSAARDEAARQRTLLREGRDPVAEREAAEAAAAVQQDHSFRAAAEALITAKSAGWRNAKHAAQWRNTLKAYVYPWIGDMPVAQITTRDVETILAPIWTRAPETASRVRGRIEAVLDSAAAAGWRDPNTVNPARWKGHLAARLPSPRKVRAVEHQPALAWQRMPAFMAELARHDGIAALALRFLILTAARSGEVRGMRWGEVDLEAQVWTVPAARMKARRQHRIPLSSAAVELLRSIRPGKPAASSVVFPGARKGLPLSDMALSMLVRGMCSDGLEEGELPRWRDAEGRAIVPHGFRSTFRDWAGETRPEGREVVERALAHTIKDKAEAAYARSDLLEKRRPLMEAWAEHCLRTPARVVSLAGRSKKPSRDERPGA